MIRLAFWGVALFFASTSLLRLSAHFSERTAIAYREKTFDNPTQANFRDELEYAERAEGALLSTASSAERLFWVHRRRASDTPNIDLQIGEYCRALSAIGRAMQKAPRNSLYLTYWSDLRQLLDDIDCELPHTSGDAKEALEYALKLDPSNPSVHYMAGVVYSHLGRRDLAAKEFREILSFPTTLNALRRQSILSFIETPEELESVIPARFPQALTWTNLFKRERPFEYLQWEDAFARILQTALETSTDDFQAGEIAFPLHLQRLQALTKIIRHEELRKRLDAELHFVLQLGIARQRMPRSNEIAEYFRIRSQIDQLETVPGFVLNDTRPKKTPIAYWGESQPIQFTQFEQSVGLFVADEQVVGMLEIEFPAGGISNTSAFRLMVSKDNASWTDFPGLVQMRTIEFNERTLVGLHLSPEYYPYWKINIPRKLDDAFFQFDLSSSVRAYGATQRGN